MKYKSNKLSIYQKRLSVAKCKVDGAFFVNVPENVAWLSGFKGSDGYLLLTQVECYFITDRRYQGLVEAEVDASYTVVYIEKRLSDTLVFLLKKEGFSVLSIEDEGFSIGDYNRLVNNLSGFTLTPICSLVTKKREQKDYFEVGKIKEALRITEEAMAYIASFVRPGMSEREVAAELEYYCKLKGSEGPSFETIVASGARSAIPHGTASSKIIKVDELVLLDFGVKIGGYCSDFTRVIYTGATLPTDLFDMWVLVKMAHDYGMESIRAGNVIANSDRIVRDYFAENKVLDEYLHSLGHGVGLKIHESPSVSYKAKGKFENGMVVTVEPGLYRSNLGGIRLEDMVLVGRKGCEVLTDFPLDIAVIG